MKKKLILVIASVIVIVTVAACNGGPRPTPSPNTYPDGFLEKTPDPVDTPDYTVRTPEPNA